MRATISLILIIAFVVSQLPPRAWAQTTEADVYVQQAVLDFDEHRYDSALENLRHALEIEPDHIEALYYAGVVHMALRQPGQAIPYLLRARQQSPNDPSVAFQLGLAYFAQQDYDKAAPLLEQVYRTNQTLDGLGYYVGFMRYRKKDYRGALEAFRGGRATDPDIQQLTRFYAGLTLAVLGQPSQAIAEVEQAMRLAPGSALTGPAERLRDTIVTAKGKERLLSAELRLGGFFDDNVRVVPNPDTSEAQVAELRHAAHESFGELVGLRVDYSWLRQFVRSDAWDSAVGYSFFGTYNNDLPHFNVTNHLVNGGVTYRTSLGAMPAQTGVQYAWDVLYLNEEEFVKRHTGTAFAALVESDMHLTQAFGRVQDKRYSVPATTPEQEIRDGDNYMGGFLHLVRFKQDAHFVKVGYQFDYDNVSGHNFEYRGHRLVAGAQYTLPWYGVRLKYDFDGHFREYVHVWNLPGIANPGNKKRQDEELTNTFRTEIPFLNTCVRRDDCIAWTLAAEYQRTNAISNIPIFDYKRNVFSLILSLSY